MNYQGGDSVPDCRIHRHFTKPGHYPEDLRIMLVDCQPVHCRAWYCLNHCLRLRLENQWTLRLNAQLNKRSRLWHSFAGASQARTDVRPLLQFQHALGADRLVSSVLPKPSAPCYIGTLARLVKRSVCRCSYIHPWPRCESFRVLGIGWVMSVC